MLAVWLGLGVWLVDSRLRDGSLSPGEWFYEERVLATMLVGPPLFVAAAAGVLVAIPMALGVALGSVAILSAGGLVTLGVALVFAAGALLKLGWSLARLTARHVYAVVRERHAARVLRRELLGITPRAYRRLRARHGERFSICAGCRGALLIVGAPDDLATCSITCAFETHERATLFLLALRADLPMRAARRLVRHPPAPTPWEEAYRVAAARSAPAAHRWDA